MYICKQTQYTVESIDIFQYSEVKKLITEKVQIKRTKQIPK